MKKLVSLLLAVMLVASLTACGNSSSKELVMGTNAAFEPFEYLEGSNVVGFDVDIANEIAKDMKKTLKIEDMDFDGLIGAVTAGKIDVAIAGMSVTDERKQSVDFSEPYYSAAQVIIVPKTDSKVTGEADLEGKTIGVQEGTTGDLYVTDNCKAKEVVGFKSGIEASMELANGKLDAVVIDAQPAAKIVAQNDKLTVLPKELTKEEYAIAVKKGNTEVLDAINKTLKRIKADGTYMTIMEKYLPEDAAALKAE